MRGTREQLPVHWVRQDVSREPAWYRVVLRAWNLLHSELVPCPRSQQGRGSGQAWGPSCRRAHTIPVFTWMQSCSMGSGGGGSWLPWAGRSAAGGPAPRPFEQRPSSNRHWQPSRGSLLWGSENRIYDFLLFVPKLGGGGCVWGGVPGREAPAGFPVEPPRRCTRGLARAQPVLAGPSAGRGRNASGHVWGPACRHAVLVALLGERTGRTLSRRRGRRAPGAHLSSCHFPLIRNVTGKSFTANSFVTFTGGGRLSPLAWAPGRGAAGPRAAVSAGGRGQAAAERPSLPSWLQTSGSKHCPFVP